MSGSFFSSGIREPSLTPFETRRMTGKKENKIK
jgi:hypothetical protein